MASCWRENCLMYLGTASQMPMAGRQRETEAKRHMLQDPHLLEGEQWLSSLRTPISVPFSWHLGCYSCFMERYYVLYIRPSRIHRRKFDPKGNEIEPNFSATRKVNTGFLMSSYKVEAKGDSDRLTPEALKGLVNKPELLALTESLTPAETVAFWMPESEMEALELELGAGVRLKTRGDGPFLDSLAKLEAGTVTKCNFAGDGKTGASWTDNILAQKSSEGATAETREQGDGAEDEEWDD